MNDTVELLKFLSKLLGVDIYIVFGVVVCVVAVLAFLDMRTRRRSKRERRKALRAVARSLGLSFSGSEYRVRSGCDPLVELHLFSKGRSGHISNVIWGEANGVPIRIFDHWFGTGMGDSPETRHDSVMVFDSSRLCVPRFALRPESGFDKISSLFGYQDIDFPSHRRFSRKYLLQGGDEFAVRRVFTEDVLRYYEANPDLCTEAAGHLLVYYRLGDRCVPEEMHLFIEEGFEIFALFARVSYDVRSERRALLAEYDRPSRVKARVTFDGVRFRLGNVDTFPWQHVCLNVNGTRTGGGYSFERKQLPAGHTLVVPARDFRKLDGTRYHPAREKPRSLYVFCENESGDLLDYGVRFK